MNPGMDIEEFRTRAKEMVDFICEYIGTVHTRRVTPTVDPGYLRKLIPEEPPKKSEPFDNVMEDFSNKILPGLTHWQHPRFHAYFPAGVSYPSILADMLSDAVGIIGFSWAASPAATELETIVLDWMAKAVGLPDDFLFFSKNSKGGGAIQSSATESILVSVLSARVEKIQQLKQQYPDKDEGEYLSHLVAYCSEEAHNAVEKACKMAFVKIKMLPTDAEFSMRGDTVRKAIEEDIAAGLIPFFVCGTWGTTSCCSFDRLDEIGPVCKEYGVWLHVDAAYAGSGLICPELREHMKGVEHLSSLNFNPMKWLLINPDCALMWVRDRKKLKLHENSYTSPTYLQNDYAEKYIEYRHWGIPLGRRFRSLKIWFVVRSYGIDGLQAHIRNHCRLAKRFEQYVREDGRFDITNEVALGLVCFRLSNQENRVNQLLLRRINESGKIHMVPATLKGKYTIRFCVCDERAKDADIDYAWNVVKQFTDSVLTEVRKTEMCKSPEESKDLEYCENDGSGVNFYPTKNESKPLL